MDTQLQALTPHLDDPPARRAPLAALASVAGLLVSLRATWLKFRLDHLCDATGCASDSQHSWLTCDEALASPWSTLATLPITILSAALYTVTLALSLALILRKGPLWPAARPLLNLCTVAAALVCAALATHAFTHFSHACPYCITLYITTIALVIGAPSSPLRTIRRWIAAIRARSQSVLDASLIALTIGVIALAAQTAAYRLAARSATCPPVMLTELPGPPTIRHTFGGDVRELVILFADPACATCRRELHAIHQSQLRYLRQGPDHAPWSGVELWVYPTPLDPCTDADAPQFVDKGGNPLTSSQSRRHDACLAARALECAAQQQPQRGLEAFDALFALHDTPAPFFTRDKLIRALTGQVSRDFDQPRLRACIDDPRTAAAVSRHQRLFSAWCQGRATCTVPHALVIPVEQDIPRLERATAADSAAKLLDTLQPPRP